MTAREQLYNLGMEEWELDNHETDLYVLKNATSEEFVRTYEFKQEVETFQSEFDGKTWYCLPFAYSEFRR